MEENVEKIKLAGGFARYLNLDSVFRIGMLPKVPVEICGNLSLAGAARLAAAPESISSMTAQTRQIRELHLNGIPGFSDLFTKALLLEQI